MNVNVNLSHGEIGNDSFVKCNKLHFRTLEQVSYTLYNEFKKKKKLNKRNYEMG